MEMGNTMRAILGLCVGVAALFGTSQQASAAFSFILSPSSSSLIPGGPSQVLTVTAFDNTAGIFGNQFVMSAVANITGGNPNITFSGFTPFVANTTVYTVTTTLRSYPISSIVKCSNRAVKPIIGK